MQPELQAPLLDISGVDCGHATQKEECAMHSNIQTLRLSRGMFCLRDRGGGRAFLWERTLFQRQDQPQHGGHSIGAKIGRLTLCVDRKRGWVSVEQLVPAV